MGQVNPQKVEVTKFHGDKNEEAYKIPHTAMSKFVEGEFALDEEDEELEDNEDAKTNRNIFEMDGLLVLLNRGLSVLLFFAELVVTVVFECRITE